MIHKNEKRLLCFLKNKTGVKMLLFFALFFAGTVTTSAQGIEVHKKDGQVVRYRYHDIDSIVPYNAEMPFLCEAVDLGLSVQWATCNIGAAAPEDYGIYFAWGETEAKQIHTAENSTFYSVDYAILQQNGVIDDKGTLLADYDVANIIWGEDWRMPTAEEQDELLTQCTWTWENVNGVCGYRVTGPNGNSIFLPAAGYCRGEYVFGLGNVGYLWSSTAFNDYGGACSIFFHPENKEWNDDARYYGHSVRPVISSYPPSETDDEHRSGRLSER